MNVLSNNDNIEQTIDIIRNNISTATKKLSISPNNVRMIVFNEMIKYGLDNLDNSTTTVSTLTENVMNSIVCCMYDKDIV
jgi:hypothetical protein